MFHFSFFCVCVCVGGGGQKMLDRECLVSWSIAMVEKPVIGPKFRPFFYTQLQITTSVFLHNKLS
jgi:hypothetical protein